MNRSHLATLTGELAARYGVRLDTHLSDGAIVVDMIAVPRERRGEGVGSAVMRELTALADAEGRRMLLTPGLQDPRWGTTSRARLVKFYKRLGFVENKGRHKDFTISHGMYREPLKAGRAGGRSLPVVEEEKWEDGSTLRWLEHPFGARRKLHTGRHDFVVEQVPIDKVVGSQKYVEGRGVDLWMTKKPVDESDLPYVYAEEDGSFTIGDGHHRFAAAHLRGDKVLRARVGRKAGRAGGSEKTIRLYHGTTLDNARSIEKNGLRANLMTAGWYTLTTDKASAIFHAVDALVTFDVPVGGRADWSGFPYLWKKPHEHAEGSLWYALKAPLPKDFVTRVERLAPGVVAREKERARGQVTAARKGYVMGFVEPGIGHHLSHGFYALTDGQAKELARGVGKKLPDTDRELRVELPDGRLAWLKRTPHSKTSGGPVRGWVWAIYGFEDQKGPTIGDVARIKVLGVPGKNEADASIGHAFFFAGEKVVERLETKATVHGERETVYVTITSLPDIVGKPTQGRVLLSYDRGAHVSYGGFYFVRSYNETCIQSLYLVEEYRKGDLGALLAQLAKNKLGIHCVFEPLSPAGKSWANRHGFLIRRG